MSSSTKRAALYVRVSTDAQTVENQIRELRQVAKRRGWDVVEVYSDAGVSGAKGRNGRPGPLAERFARHDPTPRSLRRGLVSRSAGHRHDHADGQARFPANWRLC